MKRTGKWYFKNEKEIMRKLGLEPTKGSGSGWIVKEDGQNENVIAQLKSTDKESYKLNKLDLEKLEYHANVEHKIPLFVIQFLQDNELYFVIKPQDIEWIYKYIKGDKKFTRSPLVVSEDYCEVNDIPIKSKQIKSTNKSKCEMQKLLLSERKRKDEQYANFRKGK